MAVCFNCKNNRRQLLKLNCKHDTCIRCAADNYFLNCKNKINQKNTPQVPLFTPRTAITAKTASNRLPSIPKLSKNSNDISWKTSSSKKNTSKTAHIQRKQEGKDQAEREHLKGKTRTPSATWSRRHPQAQKFGSRNRATQTHTQ